MKTSCLYRYVLALSLLLSLNKSYAQCAAPTAATATPSASACINNGKITITGVTGGPAVSKDTTLEYAIVGYTGSGPSLPVLFQSSNVFTDLYPGTYIVSVRRNCQGTYSTEFQVSGVEVNGSYTPLSAATVSAAQLGCRLGKVTVTATGGYLGTSVYRYQRVNNITSSLWDTAAAKQTSNVFNLAAGTYYIRVFDSCGSYITREVTVSGSATTTNPYTLSPFNRKRFIRTACGAYTYQFFKPGNTNFTNGNLVMGGTKAKTYLFGPASATVPIDSSALMTTGTADRNISALLVPANKKTFSGMDVYGPFYEKVIDSCGTVFYSDSLYLDTTSVLTATLTRSAPRCDTANLVLTLTEPGSNYTGVSVGTAKYRVRASNLVAAGLLKYTNDSGITWIANATDTNVLTSELHDGKWGIAVCADTVWLNAPDTVAFNVKVLEANAWACPGNTGLYLNPAGNFGAAAYAGTTVQFTSAPAAYTVPLSTVFNNKGQIIADPSDVTNYFFNLPVGTYTYTLTNECGQTYSDTINANTGRVITPVISATNACATGKVQILPQINTTQQGSSAINTAGGASRLRYTIQHRSTGTYLNAGGAAGTAGSLTPSVVNRGLAIAAINAPDTGWYVITVWPDSTLMKTHEFCPVMDSVHIANIPAPLASTSQFSSCRTGSTGIIIAGSTGGTAPYKYEVLDVTSGTLYGPQTSTTFTGLNVSHVFEVRVTDTCGNTSSNRNTFDTVSTKVTRIGTACLGTNTEFRVADAPGAVYRWMKGGDTVGYDRVLPLTPIAVTDSGMYTIIIRRATCTNDILDSFKFAVDTIPVAPTVTTPVNICKDVTATALTATGVNLKWYNDAVGGTPLGSAPVPATTAADTFSFFVSQTSAKACESPRAELSVQVNPLPADAPVVTTPVTYCSGIPAVALTATGVDLRWFTAATGGTGSATAPVPATSSAGTTKHYVAQSTPAGCTGPRAEIQVVVNPTPAAPVVTTPIAYCAGATTTALTATTITGASLLWYTAATGGTGSATAFVPDASVAKDSIFYVSQNSDKNCEGPRAAITVNVNPLPAAPAVTTPVNLCDGKPATALTATGTTLKWYTVPTAGTGSTTAPVPSTAGTSTNTWYVSQTTAKSCEGPRAAILVNVNPTPTVGIVPKDGVDFIFCPGLSVVLQAVSATATAYQWHLEGIDIGGATMDTLDVTINGNYSVTVTNAFGCKAENTVYAFRDTTRPSVLAPTELTKCEDAMVMLYCHPGFTGYKYEWRKDGVIMTGVTTSSEGAKASGVYTVTVTNTLGCVMTTNSSTIVNYPAIIKPTIVRTDPVLSLDNTYTNYQWFRNGGPLSGATKAKLTMTADGEYYCYVSDKNGCRIYSDTVKVKLTSIPGTTVQELKLYPNPTTAKVIIEASEKVNVVVTDLTGQVVIRREEAKEIDLQQLADGFYFFHITDLNGLPVRVEKINKVSSR